MKQKARATVSEPNHDGAPRVADTHTRRVRRRRAIAATRRATRRRRVHTMAAPRQAITGRDASWRGVVRHTSSPPRAACPSPPPPHTINKTQVHAAFDVQDTEAWSNADDLRTPSEVKAELARLRQLALACVTAKMDNKKVNDKIDLNARARRPTPSMRLVGRFFGDFEAIPRRRRRRPPSTRLPS